MRQTSAERKSIILVAVSMYDMYDVCMCDFSVRLTGARDVQTEERANIQHSVIN